MQSPISNDDSEANVHKGSAAIESESNPSISNKSIWTDPSFLGIAVTQFLGAFNDNLYKQLMLLLAIPIGVAAMQAGADDQAAATDVQGWATAIFSLPFVLFSGFAGYLSDKFSKRRVIVLSKVAEIVIMSLSAIAFLTYDWFGMAGTWFVLFAMATQSSFFGPGKYGILPELFAKPKLASVNGIILMTTFLAIILGTLAAGAIFDQLAERGNNGFASAGPLWKGSVICIAIAVAGTVSSLFIRPTKPAEPTIQMTADTWWINQDIRQTLMRDKPLLIALLVSCVFWLISGICVPVINRVGELLQVSKFQTSILVAAIALGIMVGSIVVILMQRVSTSSPRRQVSVGLWGMFGTLSILAIWQAGNLPFLSYWMIFATLLLLGIFVATYAIPLQVFLQDRPPDRLKGRMIATMNQANFIGILISGPLYQLFQGTASWIGLPVNTVFGMMAILLLPVAILYRLDDSPVLSK